MNYMLYIIIALVLIVLVGLLVLRNIKAKKSATKPVEQVTKDVAAVNNTPVAKPQAQATSSDQPTPTPDPLAVAQDFINQQRYDKAIETLKSGLARKPQDAKLLLKLLNIYAITNQHNDFNRTYDVIITNSDAATLNEANQLKALLEQEQTQNQPVQPAADTDSGFESLDFDLSTLQSATETQPAQDIEPIETLAGLDDADLGYSDGLDGLTSQNEPVALSQDVDLDSDLESSLDSPSEKTLDIDLDSSAVAGSSFDLTLDDLEGSDSAVTPLESPASDDGNDVDSNTDLSFEPVRNPNIDDDFTLSFDTLTEESLSTKTAPVIDLSDSDLSDNLSSELPSELPNELPSESLSHDLEEISLSDDFALDFDNLTENADIEDVEDVEDVDEASALFAEEQESIADENNTSNHTANTDTEEETYFPLDELSFNDDTQPAADNEALVTIETDISTDIETPVSDAATSGDEELSDNVLVDDELGLDAVDNVLAATAPVEVENDLNLIDDDSSAETEALVSQGLDEQGTLEDESTEVSPAIDFASQFAADFDFVNTLDSHQITLDLASQYLELGEYDSAKRLLSEVIAQGNSEQQSQAQELLARTA